MDKISQKFQEIESLKKRKEKLNLLLLKINDDHNQAQMEIAQLYEDFYLQKKQKEFVYYKNYPSMEALQLYLGKLSKKFPLDPYGMVNVKELAEVIKHLYQFKTGNEYQILTIGVVERDSIPAYGAYSYSFLPHLYFLVGNEKTLSPYREYDGKFIHDDRVYAQICLDTKMKNLVLIEAENDLNNTIEIECYNDLANNRAHYMNYYHPYHGKNNAYGASIQKNVFANPLSPSLLHKGGYQIGGIKDVMSFSIHPSDSFLARVVISMIIYKKNNAIENFMESDYQHIFDVLFHEKVSIVSDAQKDIQRTLTYVQKKY